MIQQGHSSESLRQLTSIATQRIMSVMGLDGVTSFSTLKRQIHVNVCETIKLLAGFLKCNGRKLEEAKDFKCVFVFYCLFEAARAF